jgi:hypothetical protein
MYGDTGLYFAKFSAGTKFGIHWCLLGQELWPCKHVIEAYSSCFSVGRVHASNICHRLHSVGSSRESKRKF